jgi:hypothetical protein
MLVCKTDHYYAGLPHSSSEAMGKFNGPYLLLLYHQKYYAILYYPETEELVEPNLVALLDLIECSEATETANVDPDFIEALSDTSIQAWCHQHDISPEQIQRICTLYLQPEATHSDLKAYLTEAAISLRSRRMECR